MNNILLVTVTRVEADAVLNLFPRFSGQKWERREKENKTYYELGIINDSNIVMVQSEMGTSGSGGSLITVHKAIEAIRPDKVIMIGIAFGVNPKKQRLGEILVSRQLVPYEPQKIKGGEVIHRGGRYDASVALLDKFQSGALDWQGPKVHFGLMLSGEKLIADQEFRDHLLKLEPEAIGGEMEGTGLYTAASEAKVDWILVKAICDWGDGNKSDDYQSKAAQNAAEYVLHVLQQSKPNNWLPTFRDILKDYEVCLDIFFDPDSGAVLEPGRDDGTPRFLFTEVTGYAIKDFLLLYSLTGNGEYLDKAKKSADWIKDKALDSCGGVKTRYFFDKDTVSDLIELSFYGRRIYSFDTAICLSALVALFRISKNTAYREVSIVMGNFLITRMTSDSGIVFPIYNAITGTRMPDDEEWSKRFGAYHSKVAEALVDLYSITQDDKYLDKAVLICKETLKFQKPEGNFETSVGKTELHPHCYATEGLLHVGQEIHDKELINAARRATEWALRKSQKGEISQVIDVETGTDSSLVKFRTDTLAQILALAADLLMIGELDNKYQQQINEIASKLLEMKSHIDKCFRYGFYEKEVNGKLESDTKSYWTNMFCLRGLNKYYLASMLAKTDLFILAGGIGSRCWPISSETKPKHLSLNLLGDRCLLQETIRRYTYNHFIRTNQIYILCNDAAKQETWNQVKGEGIPYENIIVEKSPDGTIPAVWKMLNELKQRADRDGSRNIIVSMSDNVIEPYENFQNALVPALFTSNENECIVSVGKPVNKNQAYDNRFGYMAYSKRINSYRCYQVNVFKEKPDLSVFEELMQTQDNIAWEGGTVVASETYFRKIAQDYQEKGNLAEHLLAQATTWSSSEINQLNVAVSILDASSRFEDFGVPGQNLHEFFLGDEKYDLGSGNICLGNPQNIRMLYCSNNLIIGDKLPMTLYGLNNYLIIDDSWTNTTVLMPLERVDELPTLYRVLDGAEKYKPFITGGSIALEPKVTFTNNCKNTQLSSDFGLVFASYCNEKISVDRLPESIHIFSQELPEVKPEDYENLYQKQLEDPKLAEHLIHVAALAGYFRGDEIHMSKSGREMLRLLCLYHDFGGYLSDEKEKLEAEFVYNFQKISKLDRRLLDTRIINALLESYPSAMPTRNEELIGLMNDSVNSAVEFLKRKKVENTALRDIVLFLVQIQDAPGLFAGFRNSIRDRFGFSLEEVEKVYACFKIADHFSNGRWLWKRSKYISPSYSEYQGFLRFDEGPLEDFPFTVSFTVDWFQKAHIKPNTFVNRLNDVLSDDNSLFRVLLNKLQGGKALLTSDMVYCYLLKAQEDINKIEIKNMINEGIHNALTNPEELFQLYQILELPFRLKNIMLNSVGINKNAVNLIAETILNEYHANRQRINNFARESINHLLVWETLV